MTDFTPTPERQNQIIARLARLGRLSVAEIVTQFSISQATARRDLEALAHQGRLQRVHGGAMLLKPAPPEPPILQRESEQAEEKQRIGRAAAESIAPGETVFLGSGTTVLAVARSLKEHPALTVITNSLPVLNILSGLPNITIIALGGMLRPSELSFIGHITEQALAEVRADKVIIGIHALSLASGLTNDYLPETLTDRAILRAGRQVILVADHTKIDTVAAAFLAPLSSIQRLITGSSAPVDFISALRQQQIEVTLV